MVIFPNAKINLGLHILRKRNDGFHDIETVFYPVPLSDILEINYHEDTEFQHSQNLDVDFLSQIVFTAAGKKVVFQMTGLKVDGDFHNNLIFKALQLFENQFGLKSHVHIHLHKVIPMGAGLGGGSADAAFLLKQLWLDHHQPCSENELMGLASQIGSDCAFFIRNEPSFATGKGEELTPVSVSLKGYAVVIVKPPVHVVTAEAYAGVVPVDKAGQLSAGIQKPISEWSSLVVNDFELSVFNKYPEIKIIRQSLMKSGAIYASMSGSGSAVFGLFQERIPDASHFPGCFYYCSAFEN